RCLITTTKNDNFCVCHLLYALPQSSHSPTHPTNIQDSPNPSTHSAFPYRPHVLPSLPNRRPRRPRNHRAIFVQMHPKNSGFIFQVSDNVQEDMHFNHREPTAPEESPTFIGKTHIGTILKPDFERIHGIVEGIEAPKKQFDGPRRIDAKEPLRRC
ncbi:hypothetical protein K458DRAFT_463818, partial [Lentithecium fluviatile CBS 122367]